MKLEEEEKGRILENQGVSTKLKLWQHLENDEAVALNVSLRVSIIFFFFLKRAFYFQLEKREHVWYTGPEEDTSVFILEKKLSDSLYYDSVDEVSTLLCNDRRGGQEGSCQRNLRTWADSYLIIEELEDISHGRAGCLDQLVSSWASKKTFLFDNWFKPFVPISISWKP